MKKAIYIITGCLIIGICTINSGVTITANKQTIKQAELNNAVDKLDYVKEMYLNCLENYDCNECTWHYEEVKNAYDNFNKLNK